MPRPRARAGVAARHSRAPRCSACSSAPAAAGSRAERRAKKSLRARAGAVTHARVYDAVVIGAGFGGLGAALELARAGAKVALCEALNYPGGCASTFSRQGFRFEAGATLFTGFAPGQLFERWIAREALEVPLDWLDPVVELRTGDFTLPVWRDRERVLAQLEAMPDAPKEGLRRFFALQRAVGDALWPVMDEPERLELASLPSLGWHALRSPRYLKVARWVGRPLGAVLEHCGLSRFTPLRALADALCQITVQCPAAEAEAPFALSAMEYCWRGAAHVRGGVGVLAQALTRAIAAHGGEVLLANRVKSVERRAGGGFVVHARRGSLEARRVVANVLPGVAQRWLGPVAGLPALDRAVQDGWGAVMRYLVVRGEGPAHHLELVDDLQAPFIEGNHAFASVSGEHDVGRAPDGCRTVTVSTHVPLAALRAPHDAKATVDAVQARLERTLQRRAPELLEREVRRLTASPRTFERFTGRPEGAVGGVPRRAGLHNYQGLFPSPVVDGFWLVGDSVFPGQSTLSTALGGVRVARRIAR
ncbi:MAG: NAD(P)/FAD-dependent oxidoreductase [Myxococcaceae bacterium]|nr:NAD(P)/FAD-dependent oxidoreductase [Myxococcaceae bacterium]